jgi:hypothetical protein
MPQDPTERLEVLISSEMGLPRWTNLRSAARQAISSAGFDHVDFEGIAPGPIEGGLAAGDLGVRLAQRADMVVAIIGPTLTQPVFRELQAALERRPRPPIGVFFDTSARWDESAEDARTQLRDVSILGDFSSPVGLRRHVTAFLAQKVHLARHNRESPVVLARERIVVAPGEEERRAFMVIRGDTLTAIAEAQKPDVLLPRQKFHFALLSTTDFVRRTANQPFTEFGIGEDRYTFESRLTAGRSGYCYVVVRRPWWFQLGRATVDLTITLSRGGG